MYALYVENIKGFNIFVLNATGHIIQLMIG